MLNAVIIILTGFFSLLIPFAPIILIVLIILKVKSPQRKEELNNNRNYNFPETLYSPKKNPMTKRELKFFHNLELLIGDKYYIVPQVHLSSILEAPKKLDGFKYNPYFNKINSKSVDFVLFTKPNYDFKLAIELDDTTHQRRDRINRDNFVNEIMHKSGQKLVRMYSFDVAKVVEYL